MKQRLTENQVTRLLQKGYTYKDIALYEQAWLDSIKKGASALGDKALDYMVPDVIATPDQVKSGIKNIGTGIGNVVDKLKNTDVLDKAAELGSTVGGLVNPIGGIGSIAGDAVGNLAKQLKGTAADAGRAAGALGTQGGTRGLDPEALKPVQGQVPFGSFEDMVGSKIKQIQGEGYSFNDALTIVEHFAGKTFGKKYLSENISNSKIRRVRFNENELKTINEAWNRYLVEQSLSDIRKELEEQGGSPIDGFKQMFQMLGDKENWKDVGRGFSQLGGTFKDAASDAWSGFKNLIGIDSNSASDAAAKTAADVAALSKNESMTPHDNHQALRDWTSKMKESLMQETDYDGDGKVETGSQEYLGSRDKAIKKAMSEKTVFYTDDEGRKRVFDDNQ